VGERLAGGLKRAGAADSLFVHADVRFEREVAELISAAVKSFGRLDVAVNDAGTEGRSAPIVGLTATHYAETFATNVLGTLLSMKHRLMRVMQTRAAVRSSTSHLCSATRVFPIWRWMWPASTLSSA
jgi:NAD(P)-dependent dehydrogenase (short-subunit alcohol dehydrogenase family)